MSIVDNTHTRSRLSPDDRRRQLLDCAIHLFADKGLGDAKHADIAEIAGVSVATTFVYFETREALIDAVLDEVAQYQLSVFENAEPISGSLSDILHSLAYGILAQTEVRPHYAKVWLGWSTSFDPAKRQAFLKIEDETVTRVAALLQQAQQRSGTECRDDARILIAASQTLSTMKLDNVDEIRMRRFIDHTINVVLASAGK